MQPDAEDLKNVPTIRPATSLSRRFVRYLLGFGVGVAVGLAPYLGLLNIPLFKPLLTLIPESIREIVLPLSAALMGTVAIVVQWYGGEHLTRAWTKKMFARTLVVLALTFVALTVVHTLVVVTLPIEDDRSISFVVGFTRPNRPPCTADVSDAACIKEITSDPSAIESFWGDRQIRIAKLALIFSYLLFTSSFGALVGLTLLRDQAFTPRRVSRSQTK